MRKEEAEAIWTVSITTETLLGLGLSFTLVVNLFVGKSMNTLLSLIKNLQILVHLTLMQVLLPANSQLFMSVIFGSVTFDPFDTSSLTASYYTPTDVEMNDKLDQLGYQSAACIINLGSCLYFIFGQIFIIIL